MLPSSSHLFLARYYDAAVHYISFMFSHYGKLSSVVLFCIVCPISRTYNTAWPQFWGKNNSSSFKYLFRTYSSSVTAHDVRHHTKTIKSI